MSYGGCNCPQYHVPSADPNESRGCPVHDPNYVDPFLEIRGLKADLKALQDENAKLKRACGVSGGMFSVIATWFLDGCPKTIEAMTPVQEALLKLADELDGL